MTTLSISYHIPSFAELREWSFIGIARWLPIFDGQPGNALSVDRLVHVMNVLGQYHQNLAGDVNSRECHALGYTARFIWLSNQMIADGEMNEGEQEFLLHYPVLAANVKDDRMVRMCSAAWNELLRRTFNERFPKN